MSPLSHLIRSCGRPCTAPCAPRRARGRTILFSSHTLSEVEELCDHVAILRDGHLVEQDRIRTLRRRAVRHVDVRFRPGATRPPAPAELRVVTDHDNRLGATWVGPVEPLLAWLAACGVEDVTIGQPDLQDLFLAYYDRGSEEKLA